MKGIDISEFQENVNYKKLKEQGIEFAIIRLGYGKNFSQKDSMFETHFEGLKNAGIKVGAYLYSYAYVKDSAKLEAENTLKIIQGKQFDLPIFYDMEESKQANLGKNTLTDMANEWCRIIKNAGYKAGVYANLNWFKNYLNPYEISSEFNYIWLALWNNDENPNVEFPVDFWQYSSEGKLDGIQNFVDLNKCYSQDFTQPVENVYKIGIYQNGSTKEPVYADTDLINLVGVLGKQEMCECLGIYKNRAIVRYHVDNTKDNYKIGFVKWLGGVK